MSNVKAVSIDLPVGIPLVVNGIVEYDGYRIQCKTRASSGKFTVGRITEEDKNPDGTLHFINSGAEVIVSIPPKEARLLAYDILRATDDKFR